MPIELHVADSPSAEMTPEQARVIRAVSPTIDANRIEGGAQLIIHDVAGTKTIAVNDGRNGADGRGIANTVLNADYTLTITYTDGTSYTTPSIRGADGKGIVSIVKTSTSGLVDTYTITYTDNTTATFTVTNGKDGTDGYSPTASVSKSGSTATITIMDKQGTTTAQITDGQDGSPGASAYVWIRYAATEPTQDSDMKTTPDAWMGIYSGDSATAPTAYTAYTWYNIKGQTGPVTDVQVNGTSVLQDGVANVPIATQNKVGVVKAPGTYGVSVWGGSSAGFLALNPATGDQSKAGNTTYNPIVPVIQHYAAFYGLAKAAGDSTQSASSNAVGAYTETAKSKISDMLNGPVSVSGSTPAITALPGIQYVCGECATLDITLPKNGCVDVVFESGSTPTLLNVTPPSGVTVKWANGFDPTALDANTTYEINIKDGLGVAGSWT